MAPDRRVTFFHSPQTRSSGVLALLEELQADYELRVLNMKAGGPQRKNVRPAIFSSTPSIVERLR